MTGATAPSTVEGVTVANRRSVAGTGASIFASPINTAAAANVVAMGGPSLSPSAKAVVVDKGGATSQAGGRLPVHEMRRYATFTHLVSTQRICKPKSYFTVVNLWGLRVLAFS